jgi:hypothetical protein
VPWGELLGHYRDHGPSIPDVDSINERIVGVENGPSEEDLPHDITYAVKNNVDRAAVNDGVVVAHL